MKTPYNKTQLYTEQTFEKHVFHRDQFAHYLRWTHVLKVARQLNGKLKLLDVGCGDGNLLNTLYHNRLTPERYVGVDVRKKTIDKLNDKWKGKIKNVEFSCVDAVTQELPKEGWNVITSFEVFEHIGKENGRAFLKSIYDVMIPEKTTLLLSTPVYDPKVGAANNHIINGEVGEWEHDELLRLLSELFTVEDHFGTFASKKDLYPTLRGADKLLYDRLNMYYDNEIISVLFAPLRPKHSRNCLWRLKRNK